MGTVSARLCRRIERDFRDPTAVATALEVVGALHQPERVQAAVVLSARGDLGRLNEARDLADLDWRDLLVGVGLAHRDWPARLDTELGPAD